MCQNKTFNRIINKKHCRSYSSFYSKNLNIFAFILFKVLPELSDLLVVIKVIVCNKMIEVPYISFYNFFLVLDTINFYLSIESKQNRVLSEIFFIENKGGHI